MQRESKIKPEYDPRHIDILLCICLGFIRQRELKQLIDAFCTSEALKNPVFDMHFLLKSVYDLHPNAFRNTDFLREFMENDGDYAQNTLVLAQALGHLINEKRRITPDTIILSGKFVGRYHDLAVRILECFEMNMPKLYEFASKKEIEIVNDDNLYTDDSRGICIEKLSKSLQKYYEEYLKNRN